MKINRITYVHVIIIILFVTFMFNVTKSFLKYETVTNVDLIRKYSDMPDMDIYLCARFPGIFRGSRKLTEGYLDDTAMTEHSRYGIGSSTIAPNRCNV